MPRIYLTFSKTARANYYGERALAALGKLGDVSVNPLDRALDTAELIDSARNCAIIVADRETPGTAELFRHSPNLVAFTRCAVDIRNVDVAAASECGILVTHAGPGFVASVAEWVIGVMIDLCRGISDAALAYRYGTMLAPTMGRELRHSTLGVIGYGSIGRYLCELALGLQMRVIVTDPVATVADTRIRQASMPELLAESDFVVCLAPANAQTENLMNAAAFAQMKADACFINASRGELVDDAALLRALDDGRIAGCALDVGRAPDQKPSAELASHPKVIATPHIGGLTPQAVEYQALETVEQVAAIIERRIPTGAVNADRASRIKSLMS
ncbi:MAG TPA: NAD(P)-dependent oxidoreductase [Casimicrobiaceae bacterium]|nr:NAD(P)-dependent oxidoreductase [Casimicrobiaceae bacterium]